MDGLQVIFARMDSHFEEMAERIDQEFQAAGLECQGLTKKACPVGTPESTHKKGYIGGRLRASIQYLRTGPRECKVQTNVGYGIFVELGTSKMRARPFMFPSHKTTSAHLLEALAGLGA